MPNIERTGERPVALTNWHIARNLHCRAAGVELLALEFYDGIPRAVLDYRRYEDGWPNDHPVYRALASMCDRVSLPFFLAFYHRRTWGFYLHPMNSTARLAHEDKLKTEHGFVDWMYWLRGGNGRKWKDFPRALLEVLPPEPPQEPMGVPHLLKLNGANWPGQELSLRHRSWGEDCYVVDLDFLLIDNNTGEPVALVEYKHKNARAINWSGRVIKAQRAFAGSVPFLVVRYSEDPWKFQIDNDPATGIINDPYMMDADVWVAFLNSLRRQNREAA